MRKTIIFAILLLLSAPFLMIESRGAVKEIVLQEKDKQNLVFGSGDLKGRWNLYHDLHRMAFYVVAEGEGLLKGNFLSGKLELEMKQEKTGKVFRIVYPFTPRGIDPFRGTLSEGFQGGSMKRPNDFYFYGNLPDEVPQNWILKLRFLLKDKKGEKEYLLNDGKNGVRLLCIAGNAEKKFAENLSRWKKQADKGNPMTQQLYDTTLAWNRKFSPAMDKLHPWGYPGKAQEAFVAAFAASEPGSPYYKDPVTIQFALDGINFLVSELDEHGCWWYPKRRAWKSNDPNTNRFTLYRLMDAVYCILRLPEGQKEFPKWKEPLRKAVDFQTAIYDFGLKCNETGKRISPSEFGLPGFIDGERWGGRYLNQDAMVLLAEMFAGKIFQEPRRLEHAHKILEVMKSQLLPRGGFHYIFKTDESPSYHSLNLSCIARYGTVTGDPLAKEVIRLTEHYWPNVMTQEGIPECWSDVWWKQGWQEGDIPALVISAACADSRKEELQSLLHSLLQRQQPCTRYDIGFFYAAPYWKGFQKGKTSPEKYLRFDSGAKVFRGRNGSWYYGIGTGRAMRNNFSGGLISRADTIGAFDGGMSGANLKIQPRGKRPLFLANTESKKTLCLQTLLPGRSAAMLIRYVPQENTGTINMPDADQPWEITQILVADRDGMFGMISALATKETEWIDSLTGEVSFVHHYLRQTARNEFILGSLKSKILSSSMGEARIGTGGHNNKPAAVLPVTLNRKVRQGERFTFAYWVGPGTAPNAFRSEPDQSGYTVTFADGHGLGVLANLKSTPVKKTLSVPRGKKVKLFHGSNGAPLPFETTPNGIRFLLPAKTIALAVY